GRRTTSITIATVLAPPGPLLDNQPRPVTLSELTSHVRGLMGFPSPRINRVVVVCSPTGFAPEVWNAPREFGNTKVVLVEPQATGGWKTAGLSPTVDARLLKLFDPEGDHEKRARIRREIEASRSDLLIGGLSAQTLSQRLGVPQRLVESELDMMCRSDPELHVSRADGDAMLYRGLPSDSQEDTSMTVKDWIRPLFKSRGDEAEKINHLIENRNRLAQRRDRLYEDISRLEKREQAILDEGKRSTSMVVKRRVASQLAQLRK